MSVLVVAKFIFPIKRQNFVSSLHTYITTEVKLSKPEKPFLNSSQH